MLNLLALENVGDSIIVVQTKYPFRVLDEFFFPKYVLFFVIVLYICGISKTEGS